MGRKLYANGSNIHLKDSASSKVVEFGLYGKATQDGEPTPDNPIEIVVSGSDGSVEVVSCRKNLLEITGTDNSANGIDYTVFDVSVLLTKRVTRSQELNKNAKIITTKSRILIAPKSALKHCPNVEPIAPKSNVDQAGNNE